MTKEVIIKAATIEEALAQGAEQLGVEESACTYEVMEAPKKLFSSKLKYAVLKVTAETAEVNKPAEFQMTESVEEPESALSSAEEKKIIVAKEYLSSILSAMGITDVSLKVETSEDGAVITFEGENIAVLIGHHGETLDALQYLVALACNRVDGEYFRITLDCGNYREKREETLKALAARIAAKVSRTGRSQLLEPMNPYERRIIHAVVSEIPGVFSKSKGEEPNRRVVILSETPKPRNNNRRGGRSNGGYQKKSYQSKLERTMEDILKDEFRKKEESAELYSKIEL